MEISLLKQTLHYKLPCRCIPNRTANASLFRVVTSHDCFMRQTITMTISDCSSSTDSGGAAAAAASEAV